MGGLFREERVHGNAGLYDAVNFGFLDPWRFRVGILRKEKLLDDYTILSILILAVTRRSSACDICDSSLADRRQCK